MTTSKEAAIAVWENLDDRSGFGLSSVRYDDPEIFDDIISELSKIIDHVDQRDNESDKHLRAVIETCDVVGRAYADGKCPAETIDAAERAIRVAREFLGPNSDNAHGEECDICERCVSNVPEQKLTEWIGQGLMICDDCRAWMIPDSPGLILKIVRENLAKLGLTEEEIAKLETDGVEL